MGIDTKKLYLSNLIYFIDNDGIINIIKNAVSPCGTVTKTVLEKVIQETKKKYAHTTITKLDYDITNDAIRYYYKNRDHKYKFKRMNIYNEDSLDLLLSLKSKYLDFENIIIDTVPHISVRLGMEQKISEFISIKSLKNSKGNYTVYLTKIIPSNNNRGASPFTQDTKLVGVLPPSDIDKILNTMIDVTHLENAFDKAFMHKQLNKSKNELDLFYKKLMKYTLINSPVLHKFLNMLDSDALRESVLSVSYIRTADIIFDILKDDFNVNKEMFMKLYKESKEMDNGKSCNS